MLVLMVAVPVIRGIAEDEEEEEPKPIGIVNLSENLTLETAAFPDILVLASQEEWVEALLEDTVKELFVIRQDYVSTGSVEWLHTGGGSGPGDSSATTITTVLRIALAADNLSPELLQRALAPAAFAQARLGADGLPLDEDRDSVIGRVILSLLSTMTLLVAIMVGAGALVQSVAKDKENRSIEVLLTSTWPLSLIAGKVLALGAAGLAMVLIWVGSVVVVVPRLFESFPDAPVFQVDPMLLVWVTSFFLARYFLSAVILAGIGAMSAGIKEANQDAMLVILPLIAPLQAVVLIIPNPDGGLAKILSFVPFTAPVTMMLRLAFGEPALLEVLASLALIALSAVVMLWVSARIFRAGLLMYGQRMSLLGGSTQTPRLTARS